MNTGYHATTPTQFATAFETALSFSDAEKLEMRKRARISAKRFTEEEFSKGWLKAMEELVELRRKKLLG